VYGWRGFGKVGFDTFFNNSLFISLAATVGTVFSSAIVAYGFGRMHFFGRKALFGAMLASLMLPAQVLMIPQYLWYQQLDWVGSYLPLIVPYYFAVQGFFVYLLVNFIGGLPKELDEAAKIFSEYGYENTSISMICERINVGRGTIYQYFTDKNDIFRKIIEQFLHEFEYKIKNNITRIDKNNTRQLIKRNILFVCGEVEKNKDISRIILGEARAMNPNARDLFEGFISTLISFIRDRILEMRNDISVTGTITDPEFFAVSVVVYTLGILEWYILEKNHSVDINQLADNIFKFVTREV
jgi:AcrR family transcriptional regulator